MTKHEILILAGSWSVPLLNPSILAIGLDLSSVEREFQGSKVATDYKEQYDLVLIDADSHDISKLDFKKNLNPQGSAVIGSSKELDMLEETSSLKWITTSNCSYTTYFCMSEKIQENHHFLQAACYDGYVEEYADDIEFLKKWNSGAKSVLEIGVGTGRVAKALASECESYLGVDASGPMLRTLRRSGVSIRIEQASMLDFVTYQKFDRIIFPFRVIHYLKNPEEMQTCLSRMGKHLKAEGKILINALDFDEKFVKKWNGKNVVNKFTGPDGLEWSKIDHMDFDNKTMFRLIEIIREGKVLSRSRDNLTWVSAKELSEICHRAGLEVCNIWPAYSWDMYNGEQEFVLEAKIR